MSLLPRQARVAVKYCGSCNPSIDTSQLGGHLAEVAAHVGAELVSADFPDPDIIIIVCGCNHACVNKPEWRERAPRQIVIAGETLNGEPAPEKDLPAALEAALRRQITALES